LIKKTRKTILIKKNELPAFCPPKNNDSWAMHPRVFIDLEQNKEANCPYCGASYAIID